MRPKSKKRRGQRGVGQIFLWAWGMRHEVVIAKNLRTRGIPLLSVVQIWKNRSYLRIFVVSVSKQLVHIFSVSTLHQSKRSI